MKTICVFNMKRSNVEFTKLNDILVTNKPILSFNDEFDEIPVMTETRTLICIGNISKNNLKVQFSVVEGCDIYEREKLFYSIWDGI